MTESSPWGERRRALAVGFDPDTFGERAVRRRRSDAGAGRIVDVPAFLEAIDTPTAQVWPGRVRVVLTCAPGGRFGTSLRAAAALDSERRLSRSLHDEVRARPDAVSSVGPEWTGITVPAAQRRPASRLVLRTSDWDLLLAWLRLRFPDDAPPQDAPLPAVLARHLARIDGTSAATSDWGELFLEVRATRHPDRIADTLTLGWRAHWTAGGYRVGEGGARMLNDLEQRRIMLAGLVFRVRDLPPWDRPAAAAALRLPAAAALVWDLSPYDRVLACFADGPPVVDSATPQDA